MPESDQARSRWSDHRLTNLLKVEHPIVLAPMAGLGTVALAAAVSRAGGLGSLGCAAMRPDAVRQAITDLRALTRNPINVNFFCPVPARIDPARETAWHDRLARYYDEYGIDPASVEAPAGAVPFDDARCAVVEEMRPEVVSFHFGLPQPALLARVKAAGCRVMSSATTVEEARWLEPRGVDAVIAQGAEAGGHRGTFLPARGIAGSQPGTLALVPQVADAVAVPVIAAGGIADARGVVAALALGAAGVQVGTAYLLCPEAGTSALYRDALRQAQADGTVVTNVFTGRPARALVNRLTRDLGPLYEGSLDFPLPAAALAPLRAAAESRGNRDFSPFWAGQAASLASEMPAEAVTRALANAASKPSR